MGLFSGIKDNLKKAEAAVVVQNLLEQAIKNDLLDGVDPAKLATLMVEKAWGALPDVFSGKFGQRPHKITVAAMSLRGGMMAFGPDHAAGPAMGYCLGTLLQEVAANGDFYPLNSTDERLLKETFDFFNQATGGAFA